MHMWTLSPLNYLAATTMDWCWPRSVRQWGTPHSSSLSSIWEIKGQMQSDCRKHIFIKVKQWTEWALTIREKKTRRNAHKQIWARYWGKKQCLASWKNSKFCNNLLNQKHGFVKENSGIFIGRVIYCTKGCVKGWECSGHCSIAEFCCEQVQAKWPSINNWADALKC